MDVPIDLPVDLKHDTTPPIVDHHVDVKILLPVRKMRF